MALFLASAASTGIATMVLLDRWLRLNIRESVIEHLEQLDSWAIVLELIMLAIMAISLGHLSRYAFGTWPGMLIPLFVVPVGLIFPMVVKHWAGTRSAVTASVLGARGWVRPSRGGRWHAPDPVLNYHGWPMIRLLCNLLPSLVAGIMLFMTVCGCSSPEDGRPRGGGSGGDGGNYGGKPIHAPSKIDGTKKLPDPFQTRPNP